MTYGEAVIVTSSVATFGLKISQAGASVKAKVARPHCVMAENMCVIGGEATYAFRVGMETAAMLPDMQTFSSIATSKFVDIGGAFG